MFIKPRGTTDLFDKSIDEMMFVCEKLINLANNFSFNQVRTPVFEHSELFKKNIGESTDIVSKEIYEFKDKSDRSLALRPEGTASIIRFYIENKLYGNETNTSKFFYLMNMFRYERPQNGRYREFNQFGVEYLNSNSFFDVIDCINFANQILKSFKLTKYKLKINNLGNFETRKKWISKLTKYFEKNNDDLTEISKQRIHLNPLRILDDKIDSQKLIVKNCPKLNDFLTEEEKQEFNLITEYLNKLNIDFEIDTNLVRGLDYYTNIVFEFISTSNELSKSTIIGGGNYDNLIKNMGGPDQKGLGFAIGLERLIIALNLENLIPNKTNIDSYLIYFEDQLDMLKAFELSNYLTENNIKVFMLNENKKSKVIKYCSKKQIGNIIWLKKSNLLNDEIEIETLFNNKQYKIKFNDILDFIKSSKGI